MQKTKVWAFFGYKKTKTKKTKPPTAQLLPLRISPFLVYVVSVSFLQLLQLLAAVRIYTTRPCSVNNHVYCVLFVYLSFLLSL